MTSSNNTLQHSQSQSEQREMATKHHLFLIEEELINKQKVEWSAVELEKFRVTCQTVVGIWCRHLHFHNFFTLFSPIFIFIQVWKAQLALKIRESKELKDQIEKQEKVKNHRQQFQNTGHRWRKLLFLFY